MHPRRIGEVLVESGFLDEDQVQEILRRQRHSARPFGKLASQLFNLDEAIVIACIAARLRDRCRHVNLAHESFDRHALDAVSPEAAWDHLLLPMRIEAGELVVATTYASMNDAVATLHRSLDRPFHFVLAEPRPLEQFIAEAYGFEGIDLAESVAA
jgi:type IV pilus assembly protein PilB